MLIELGRHKKLSVEERVCKKFNNKAVEDEVHFLCECPMYDDIRKLYFNFDSTNPPIDRTELFKQVFTDDSAENTRVVENFLKEAFLRRKSEMDILQPTSCWFLLIRCFYCSCYYYIYIFLFLLSNCTSL